MPKSKRIILKAAYIFTMLLYFVFQVKAVHHTNLKDPMGNRRYYAYNNVVMMIGTILWQEIQKFEPQEKEINPFD